MDYNVTLEIEKNKQEFAFGQVAKQANGAVWLKEGDTILLATVVIEYDNPIEDGDFLPLTVQYIEKSYAAGKIPGGFFKRESKPSDFETLTSRIVDRSLRPLFPKDFAYSTQITVMVFSVDKEADLQRLALDAANAALFVSDADVDRSVSALRIAKVGDALIFNPTLSELRNSTLDLYLSGSKEDLLMIEMRSIGSNELETLDLPTIDPLLDPLDGAQNLIKHRSNALSEEEFIEILAKAQERLFAKNSAYEEAFAPYKKEPRAPKSVAVNSELDALTSRVRKDYLADIQASLSAMAKSERGMALRLLRKQILKELECDEELLKEAIERVKREEVRRMILEEQRRPDGRKLDEIRPISIETNILPRAHASCLFTRGQTQALVVLTIGNAKDAQMYEQLTDDEVQNENFMLHYNFPGFSVGEASAITGVKRRELGHGNLAKRALEPIVHLEDSSIRLVSEILESNGSSSMATVCGGYLALRAADIETSDPIAGVAMGLVVQKERYAILTDITGLEDHDGDMDFKVAGSKEGITALQMDIKLGGIRLEILKEALHRAREARAKIIDIMLEAEAKIEHNEGVLPSSHHFHIDPSAIGEIIGQAGKTIKEIIKRFGVSIDIDKKSGKIKLTGTSKQQLNAAKEHIENIAKGSKRQERIEYRVGERYKGRIKRIVSFGVFVELPDGTDGLVHISKLAKRRIENIEDIVKEGDEIEVEVIELKGDKVALAKV